MTCPICKMEIQTNDAVSIDVNNTVSHLSCQNMQNKSVKKDEGVLEDLISKYVL
ncbi:Zn-finger nucleic acid-binding protein [Virgibacillus natechei]|uniref:Zn-finger nucleic acid-binding protein n=1 Tax=Virgibacillus natechei TaxID=1216297 RepID=A0ABS4IJ40_9BACI|nr:Zn-finger nucleic acid-binding protein [Virgibacillus natechei]